MKIYLDACCYNRPFDIQNSDRIIIETKAISIIFKHIEKGKLSLISSEVLEYELNENPDINKRNNTLQLLRLSIERILLNNNIVVRATELENYGFKSLDALHISVAEASQIKYFLTTDDKLIKLSKKLLQYISTQIVNPIRFIEGII